MRVILSDNGKNKTYFVHRLVAAAFIPNPDNLPEIDHIDGNRPITMRLIYVGVRESKI